MTYTETDLEQKFDRLLGEHPDLGALDNLDQFHIGGAAAVERLIPDLALSDGDVVLDVGSGFGGPARQIADRTGNRVVGIDLTPAYVDAARGLTAKVGLSHLVEFEVSDIAAYTPDAPFQAAVTIHVQMNVAEKTAWFRRIADRLVPGARLAVWEICQPGSDELHWPMPWSLDGSDSFVVSAESLRASIEGAGFTTTEWTEEGAWLQDWFASLASGQPAGPALPMLLDDGFTRVVNLAGALADGTLQVWRGSFRKNA